MQEAYIKGQQHNEALISNSVNLHPACMDLGAQK